MKTRFVGFKLRVETALWLGPSAHRVPAHIWRTVGGRGSPVALGKVDVPIMADVIPRIQLPIKKG
ncbi:hypothetical protein D8911_06725 [Levilactobacillus brevis]|nr:hypothetical protein D8911_06725 [Levilactobacillus brevis]